MVIASNAQTAIETKMTSATPKANVQPGAWAAPVRPMNSAPGQRCMPKVVMV